MTQSPEKLQTLFDDELENKLNEAKKAYEQKAFGAALYELGKLSGIISCNTHLIPSKSILDEGYLLYQLCLEQFLLTN